MPQQSSSFPYEVTLNNCDKEPIHLINAIQNHGYMLVLHPDDFSILGHSENINTLFKSENLLQSPLNNIVSDSIYSELETLLKSKSSGFFEASINEDPYIFICHKNDENIILEIEPRGPLEDAHKEQAALATIFSELNTAEDDMGMCDMAAVLVKRFLGYDRVMIYKFDEQWNGQVVSECKEDHLEPWLGLHYPATDIPKQARALFLRQGARIVADVDSKPSRLLSHQSSPFDLSLSELRSVSPIHIEYLQNMKVGATLAASIVFKDRLWGLIVGHNYSPKFINYYKRLSCKFLTQVFSSQLGLRTSNTELEKINRSNKVISNLIQQMSIDSDILKGLSQGPYSIMDINESTGAVIYIEGNLMTFGSTPPKKDLINLLSWAKENHEDAYFYSDNFSSVYPEGNTFKDIASGVMCYFISKAKTDALLWFKEEKYRAVNWAGKQETSSDASKEKSLTPRKSFATWTEEQSGYSQPWQAYEIASAETLRDHISELILAKYDEIRSLNERLTKAYKELESFSYSVSHDLRAPLRGIDGFAQIIKEDYYDSLDDFGKTSIETIISSTNTMNALIDDILSFSGLGKKKTNISEFSMQELVNETLNYLQTDIQYPNTIIEISPNLGMIRGDKSMVFQLVTNLVSNACKYSSKKSNPKVKINRTGNTFSVMDNGIGFDIKHKDKIFGVFNRLVNDEFQGSGIGLALAQRVVEKHNGKIWVESTPNEKTIFYFKLS